MIKGMFMGSLPVVLHLPTNRTSSWGRNFLNARLEHLPKKGGTDSRPLKVDPWLHLWCIVNAWTGGILKQHERLSERNLECDTVLFLFAVSCWMTSRKHCALSSMQSPISFLDFLAYTPLPKLLHHYPLNFLCNGQPHQLHTSFRLSKCNFLARNGLINSPRISLCMYFFEGQGLCFQGVSLLALRDMRDCSRDQMRMLISKVVSRSPNFLPPASCNFRADPWENQANEPR